MDMKFICAEIEEANDHEITEMVNALIERQKILHPDWEAMYISLPINHPEECKQIMYCIWEPCKNMVDRNGKRCARLIGLSKNDTSVQNYRLHIINEKTQQTL